jgi:hypothetical protein
MSGLGMLKGRVIVRASRSRFSILSTGSTIQHLQTFGTLCPFRIFYPPRRPRPSPRRIKGPLFPPPSHPPSPQLAMNHPNPLDSAKRKSARKSVITPQRKHHKMLKDGTSEVWPEDVEKVFIQGISFLPISFHLYPPTILLTRRSPRVLGISMGNLFSWSFTMAEPVSRRLSPKGRRRTV